MCQLSSYIFRELTLLHANAIRLLKLKYTYQYVISDNHSLQEDFGWFSFLIQENLLLSTIL